MSIDICEEFTKHFIEFCMSNLDKDSITQFNSILLSEFLMENEDVENKLIMLFSDFLSTQIGIKYTDFVNIMENRENIIMYVLYYLSNINK